MRVVLIRPVPLVRGRRAPIGTRPQRAAASTASHSARRSRLHRGARTRRRAHGRGAPWSLVTVCSAPAETHLRDRRLGAGCGTSPRTAGHLVAPARRDHRPGAHDHRRRGVLAGYQAPRAARPCSPSCAVLSPPRIACRPARTWFSVPARPTAPVLARRGMPARPAARSPGSVHSRRRSSQQGAHRRLPALTPGCQHRSAPGIPAHRDHSTGDAAGSPPLFAGHIGPERRRHVPPDPSR